MKQTEEIILKSLSCYIHDQALNENLTTITNEQWHEIYQLSKIHSIIPIVYEALKDNPSFLQNDKSLKQKWYQKSTALIIKQIQYTSAFLDIYQKIKEQNIDCIVTKGIILREMYKKKEWRVSGDEDIIIKKEDYHQVCQIFLNNHFKVENKIIDDHIQVTTFVDPITGLNIELHIALFGNDTYLGFLNKYFQNIFINSQNIKIDDISLQIMNDSDQLFYLICHSFKHFISTGVGLRQLMDIAMYTKLHHQNIDWDKMLAQVRSFHGEQFMHCIYSIANDFFNISFTDIHYPSHMIDGIDYSDFINDIFESGIFGIHEDTRIYSHLVVRRILNDNNKKTSLLSLIFPSTKSLRGGYPILFDHPYLLPYIWIKRIFRFKKRYHHSKHNNDLKMQEAIKLGNKRINLLKKYKIIK